MDAYSQIGKFYQSDLLLGDSQERAFSDVFHMLAEFGIIGLLPAAVVFIWLLVHYFRGSTSFLLSKLLLLACFELASGLRRLTIHVSSGLFEFPHALFFRSALDGFITKKRR